MALLGLQGLDILKTFRFPKGSLFTFNTILFLFHEYDFFLLPPRGLRSSPYAASSRWLWFFMVYLESSSQMLGAQFSVQGLN